MEKGTNIPTRRQPMGPCETKASPLLFVLFSVEELQDMVDSAWSAWRTYDQQLNLVYKYWSFKRDNDQVPREELEI